MYRACVWDSACGFCRWSRGRRSRRLSWKGEGEAARVRVCKTLGVVVCFAKAALLAPASRLGERPARRRSRQRSQATACCAGRPARRCTALSAATPAREPCTWTALWRTTTWCAAERALWQRFCRVFTNPGFGFCRVFANPGPGSCRPQGLDGFANAKAAGGRCGRLTDRLALQPPSLCEAPSFACITETNGTRWVLYDMQNRTFGPYLAAALFQQWFSCGQVPGRRDFTYCPVHSYTPKQPRGARKARSARGTKRPLQGGAAEACTPGADPGAASPEKRQKVQGKAATRHRH
jgi:hypothetical protein